MIRIGETRSDDAPVVDRSSLYSASPNQEIKVEPTVIVDESKSVFVVFFIKVLFILLFVGIVYILQVINVIFKDTLDQRLSLYPRQWSSIWCIFTCTFIHDTYHHLNSLIVFFCVCSLCVILRGNLRFIYISLIVILLGNLLSWVCGSGRMNGLSSWICGLLGYVYFSVVTDLGYPIKWTLHGLKALIIAVIVSIALVLLWYYKLIPSTTACWQYNLCGVVAGVFAAYIFTSTPLAVKLGVIPEDRLKEAMSTPIDKKSDASDKDRVIVGKRLMKFDDLRKPLV